MSQRILITGSSGLIGNTLCAALSRNGIDVCRFDLKGIDAEVRDVRQAAQVDAAIQDCNGVIHLAAISRVVWAERDPAACWETNVGGLHNVLQAALANCKRPWVIFASSREVYGQQDALPVNESAPLRPMNTYGRSKAAGEALVRDAATQGLRATTIRLSNVYGCTGDHADRVVPAFARAAALGKQLQVEGHAHLFDFTHVDDTVHGIMTLAKYLEDGNPASSPLHFLTGHPTSLGELAQLAIDLAGTRASIVQAPPRTFDVSRFYGDPSRAQALLGWTARVPLRDGLRQLIDDFRTVHPHSSFDEVFP